MESFRVTSSFERLKKDLTKRLHEEIDKMEDIFLKIQNSKRYKEFEKRKKIVKVDFTLSKNMSLLREKILTALKKTTSILKKRIKEEINPNSCFNLAVKDSVHSDNNQSDKTNHPKDREKSPINRDNRIEEKRFKELMMRDKCLTDAELMNTPARRKKLKQQKMVASVQKMDYVSNLGKRIRRKDSNDSDDSVQISHISNLETPNIFKNNYVPSNIAKDSSKGSSARSTFSKQSRSYSKSNVRDTKRSQGPLSKRRSNSRSSFPQFLNNNDNSFTSSRFRYRFHSFGMKIQFESKIVIIILIRYYFV